MKIGVVSDTHIPTKANSLPNILLNHFKDVDYIIHAGDIISDKVINELKSIAQLTAVAGNIDTPLLQEKLPLKKIINFNGYNFGITHGHGNSGRTIDRAINVFKNDNVDCIIFGHSHIPYCKYHGDILLFNPGSPTDKRRNKQYSFGIIDVNKKIKPQIIYF